MLDITAVPESTLVRYSPPYPKVRRFLRLDLAGVVLSSSGQRGKTEPVLFRVCGVTICYIMGVVQVDPLFDNIAPAAPVAPLIVSSMTL